MLGYIAEFRQGEVQWCRKAHQLSTQVVESIADRYVTMCDRADAHSEHTNSFLEDLALANTAGRKSC
jgi:hypothetical protein